MPVQHLHAVHPRVRGERHGLTMVDRRSPGSSPRSRGTAGYIDPGRLYRRFIPAFAGNGLAATRFISASTVHPRVRGERPLAVYRVQWRYGSSPRSRGTEVGRERGRCPRRFIPAFAGNGPRSVSFFQHVPVHPRVRGERFGVLICGRRSGGSSPRSRGTGTDNHPYASRRRFIPAFAGNGHA